MSAGVNAIRSASRVLLRERGREPKGMFFAQKLSNLGPVLNKPLLLKRVTEGQSPQLLGDFCDFAAKIAILTPFKSHLARFKTIFLITVNC